MKYLLFLAFSLVTSCSFKKDHHLAKHNSNDKTSADSIHIIQTESFEIVSKLISNLKIEQIRKNGEEGNIFTALLIRGDEKLVTLALSVGLSPYSKSVSYRNYRYNDQFGYEAYRSVRLTNEFISRSIIDVLPDNPEDLIPIMERYNLSCETIVDLYLDFAFTYSTGKSYDQSNLLNFIDHHPNLCQLKNSDLKNEWLSKEIAVLFLSDNGIKFTKMTNYLTSLFNKGEFKNTLSDLLQSSQVDEFNLTNYAINLLPSDTEISSASKALLENLSRISQFNSPPLYFHPSMGESSTYTNDELQALHEIRNKYRREGIYRKECFAMCSSLDIKELLESAIGD